MCKLGLDALEEEPPWLGPDHQDRFFKRTRIQKGIDQGNLKYPKGFVESRKTSAADACTKMKSKIDFS
jgi:hypothetical protein